LPSLAAATALIPIYFVVVGVLLSKSGLEQLNLIKGIKMKKVSGLLLATCLTMSTSAFAAQQFIGSFEDMKTACLNPAKFHNQIAPTNIHVACKDVRVAWVPNEGTSQDLDTSRKITVSLNSDKYTTNVESASVPSDAQSVECPSFKQIRRTVETVRDVTCDDLLSFQGTSIDFCAETTDNLMQQNQDAVQTEDTGRVFNMCSVEAPQKQEQKQEQKYEQKQEQSQEQGSKSVKKLKHKHRFHF
jgi:hypothetical protein